MILILCIFLEIHVQSFSNFRLIIATDEWKIVSGKGLSYGVLVKPIDLKFWTMSHMPVFRLHCFFGWQDQWASPKHHMKGHSRHNSLIIGRKNQAKFENYCVSRNGLRIKITQPNSMILASFSSAEDALLFNIDFFFFYITLLDRRVITTENLPFRFLGTPGIAWSMRFRPRFAMLHGTLAHIYFSWDFPGVGWLFDLCCMWQRSMGWWTAPTPNSLHLPYPDISRYIWQIIYRYQQTAILQLLIIELMCK